MKCSDKVGQKVAWYRVRNDAKINSGGRFKLTGLSLKITNVQLNDAGTYECRGESKRQYLTIYVNGEFSLCTFCSSFQHHLFFHLTIMLSCCSWCSDVSWLILLSPLDQQELMFILPVSLKLVQFEVSTLKSEEVHILEFSGEDREPPYLFSGKDWNFPATNIKSRRLQCKGYASVCNATRRK